MEKPPQKPATVNVIQKALIDKLDEVIADLRRGDYDPRKIQVINEDFEKIDSVVSGSLKSRPLQ